MSSPTKVRIRAYNVGFGDCFLLSFAYAAGADRHVLIDFGSTSLPASGPSSLKDVAERIREHTGGKLHMVAVTHRHADHLSGFAGKSGEIIAGLAPDLVVQPWTEHPDLDPEATGPAPAGGGAGAGGGGGGTAGLGARAVGQRLRDMETVARAIRRRAGHLAVNPATPVSLIGELQFLGETNISNARAVKALMTLGKRRVYASFGTRLPIASILPGVRIRVLGPPTIDQAPGMQQLASHDAQEYWHLAARVSQRTEAGDTARLFPDAPTTDVPQQARWLVPQVDRMNAEESLSIVRSIDEALNNTSLILLFDIGGTKLLFPGDAQIEDWRYALFEATIADEVRAELADTAVYKVGHHGSLNGTPKTVWRGFTRKGDEGRPDRLVSMISTRSGKHGSPSRGTEVPRRKLMDALDAESILVSTHLMRSTREYWRDVEVDLPG